MIDDGALEEVVRRVEQAPLSELVGMSIDEVHVQMDGYLHSAIDATSLYPRWEKQQRAVHEDERGGSAEFLIRSFQLSMDTLAEVAITSQSAPRLVTSRCRR